MNANKLEDESLRELFKASQKLQKCLLNFANYKPNKKNEKAKGNLTASDVVDQGIKDLVDKIVKFKFVSRESNLISALFTRSRRKSRQIRRSTPLQRESPSQRPFTHLPSQMSQSPHLW